VAVAVALVAREAVTLHLLASLAAVQVVGAEQTIELLSMV
jgi:hypothetical protein